MLNQHALSRIWRQVTPSITCLNKYKSKFDFTVLSYNVLSQLLLEDNRYLYRNIQDIFLRQPGRTTRIISELEQYNPDIVCLQEFDHQDRERFTSHFAKKGYKNVYQRKPEIASQYKEDGCFMMYRAAKFRVLQDKSIGLYRSTEVLLNKPNCAQIVLFQCADGSKMCVANTHLLYNPRRGDIKLAQISLILRDIQKLINPDAGCGGVPVIFCGDFNTCPRAPLYNLMRYGRLQYSDYSADRISGQKNGMKPFKISVGLWHDETYHEHGLRERSEKDIAVCQTTYGNLLQGVYSDQGYQILDCYKCREMYPYKPGSITHDFNFKSAYDHVDVDGVTKEVTTYIQKQAQTVDYIWYSNNHHETPRPDESPKCVHGHECDPYCSSPLVVLQARRRLLSTRELTAAGRLPNALLGSDHQALEASFTLYSQNVGVGGLKDSFQSLGCSQTAGSPSGKSAPKEARGRGRARQRVPQSGLSLTGITMAHTQGSYKPKTPKRPKSAPGTTRSKSKGGLFVPFVDPLKNTPGAATNNKTPKFVQRSKFKSPTL